MGGGIAVVCGFDSEEFESVLGDRACTGMVGGFYILEVKLLVFQRKMLKLWRYKLKILNIAQVKWMIS